MHSSFQGFETLLKEVVTAKRLSASKMGKLSEMALQIMEVRTFSPCKTPIFQLTIFSCLFRIIRILGIALQHDTQLVSTLYRTHKSLPATNKVSSLYVFDAISRAARNHANKKRQTVASEKANCATFLLKLEGILDGLFGDMFSLENEIPESKVSCSLQFLCPDYRFFRGIAPFFLVLLLEPPGKLSSISQLPAATMRSSNYAVYTTSHMFYVSLRALARRSSQMILGSPKPANRKKSSSRDSISSGSGLILSSILFQFTFPHFPLQVIVD